MEFNQTFRELSFATWDNSPSKNEGELTGLDKGGAQGGHGPSPIDLASKKKKKKIKIVSVSEQFFVQGRQSRWKS